jgi:hypothetical protein
MPGLTPKPFRRRTWHSTLILLGGLLALAGCGTPNGDFGEVRPLLASDMTHDWLGPAAAARADVAPSLFQLTEDERMLRDLAFPLIQPPYDRQRWDNVLREYGVIGDYRPGPFDRTAYAAHLLPADYRSPDARYAQLTDDIRNDITRLPAFFETASRVIDVDAKRRKSLSFIHEMSPYERENALRRIRENALILAWVRDCLAKRISSYRFALERLVISTPSNEAAQVELTLNHLQADTDRYRVLPPPFSSRIATTY